MDYLENRTFDEIALGDCATIERTLTHEDIELFAVMSCDVNPAHLDEEYANNEMFHKVIAHGMWGGALKVRGGVAHSLLLACRLVQPMPTVAI